MITIEQITPLDANGVQIPLPKADGHGYAKAFNVSFPEGCKIKCVKLHRTGISFFAECRMHENPRGQRYEMKTYVFLPNEYEVPKDPEFGDWKHIETFVADQYGDRIVHLYERPIKVSKR